uniref:ATP-binding cassette sub-family B member 6 n=1 Tax=Nothobranchius rachovii TaxID=451742 RepID=A0A1A8NP85_9TELE
MAINSYCEVNTPISHTWLDGGISPCFYFTLVPTILLSIAFLLGTIHYIFYQKYGTAMEPKFIPRSRLYGFQLVLSVLLLLLSIGGMVWQAASASELPGYVVLYGCFSTFAWAWAVVLLRVERRRVLVMDRTTGHSTVLLVFWALAFSSENLAFISWFSPHWWWGLENNQQQVQFALWLMRYISTGLLFFIGLNAPGLPRKPYMLLINEDERDVENNLLGRTEENQSTWQGFRKKVRLLVPYMWPRGNIVLQLLVLFCLGLLGAERAINVFVPIYYKNIVNELTSGSSWPTVCSTVVVYVVLKFLQGGGAGSSGFVSNVRTFMWIKVQQFTNRVVQVRLFAHLQILYRHRFCCRFLPVKGTFPPHCRYMLAQMIQNSFIDMENMFKLFEEEEEVKDEVNAGNLLFKLGKVEFENVYFSYLSGKEILRDVSFTVLPGQTVALVGPSGSGKSTIVRLLFRFYDVHGGCVRIDGQDISKVKQKSLRSHIGVVPQDTVLFNDTIRENIRYGRITASDQEVEEAAAAADIHDKIMTFPDGYDTQVGERGLKLSGGEKQRVAIARTILKAPQIVLLDEATSALDTQTERNIQASLDKVCTNRTTVVVAHRLSTIIGADQILVVSDGRIAERGRHEELLLKGGLYADMWLRQQQAHDSDSSSDTETKDRKSEKLQPPSASLAHHKH